MSNSRPEKIKQFILDRLPDHPSDIVAVTAKEFEVTRTTVHRHLDKLLKEGTVLKTGRKRGASYFLKSAVNKRLKFPITPDLEEHRVWDNYLKDGLSFLPENVFTICSYGFSEMFNNAIDHSEGTLIDIEIKIVENSLQFVIFDDGIGIFKKIKNAFNLESERESILQLSKGKLTTDREHHTGEGIFFTSRAVDIFFIGSSNLSYMKNNLEDDWFTEYSDTSPIGTYVSLQIQMDSPRKLGEVFKQFTTTDSEEIPRFNMTHINVELSKQENERFVSRSQARRILTGLEKFNRVLLDFKGIKTVGQGFVDEVFRVFKNRHPHITIEYINASEDVKFMIERSLPRP